MEIFLIPLKETFNLFKYLTQSVKLKFILLKNADNCRNFRANSFLITNLSFEVIIQGFKVGLKLFQ